jgi:IS5 family transposase
VFPCDAVGQPSVFVRRIEEIFAMVRAMSVGLVLLALLAIWDRQHAVAGTKLDAETMKAALKTTTGEEDGFIDRVVKAATNGKLPASTVDTTFQWARKKSKHKFQYFKHALTKVAADQGITIE